MAMGKSRKTRILRWEGEDVVRVSTGEVTCPESVRGSRGTACMVRSSLEMRLIYHSFCWNRQSPTTNSAAGNSYCSTNTWPLHVNNHRARRTSLPTELAPSRTGEKHQGIESE